MACPSVSIIQRTGCNTCDVDCNSQSTHLSSPNRPTLRHIWLSVQLHGIPVTGGSIAARSEEVYIMYTQINISLDQVKCFFHAHRVPTKACAIAGWATITSFQDTALNASLS